MAPEQEITELELFTVLGRIARRLGHDLRNPLSTITHAVYLLKMQIAEGDTEAAEVTADMITIAVENTELVLNELRDYVCAAPPESTPLLILEILKVAQSQTCLPESVTCTINAQHDLPMIPADGDQLLVAFRILLEFCSQAISEKGTINVNLWLEDALHMTFDHTGESLPAEIMDALLDPFTAEPVFATGLELPLAKLLIELHDGSLHSADGRSWHLVLPVVLPNA